jgi:hypothetical protein
MVRLLLIVKVVDLLVVTSVPLRVHFWNAFPFAVDGAVSVTDVLRL